MVLALFFQFIPTIDHHETEELRLKAENEALRAENAALKEAQAEVGDNNTRASREQRLAKIPPRPHTTDLHAAHPDTFERGGRDTHSPPVGVSVETMMNWREMRGRSAASARSSSTDFGPPRLRARSWLSKTCLSTKPNPVHLCMVLGEFESDTA